MAENAVNNEENLSSQSSQLEDEDLQKLEADCGVWFLRVIMSSSRAFCCLALAKKQNNDFNFFLFNV